MRIHAAGDAAQHCQDEKAGGKEGSCVGVTKPKVEGAAKHEQTGQGKEILKRVPGEVETQTWLDNGYRDDGEQGASDGRPACE